jgi:hypothetical protein
VALLPKTYLNSAGEFQIEAAGLITIPIQPNGLLNATAHCWTAENLSEGNPSSDVDSKKPCRSVSADDEFKSSANNYVGSASRSFELCRLNSSPKADEMTAERGNFS